jgi:hypothetical protein
VPPTSSKLRPWQWTLTVVFLLVDLSLGTVLIVRKVAIQQKRSENPQILHVKFADPGNDGGRALRWRQDIEFFSQKFPALQVDFATLYNPEGFRRNVVALEQEVPRLSDSDIILRLMNIVAAGGVSHDTVDPEGKLEFHPYPLRFFWFSDGPAVTEATENYKSALGARLLRIGSMTPEQFEAAVAPYLPHENLFWLHETSPDFMLTWEVAGHFGIASGDGTIEVTLARPSGGEFKLKLSPLSADSVGKMVHVDEALHLPVPLARKNPGDWYWYEYIPTTHALYVQYNRCADQKKKSFTVFAREFFKFADAAAKSHPIERVIIDLRFNSGGDSSIIEPLVEGLLSRPQLSAKGHLYVLVGRGTYSSGMMAAVELQQKLHAILVGEPAGSKPNEYGEVKSFTLPNSKIAITYTTKYFPLIGSDTLVLQPDVPVQPSIADMLQAQDKALDVAQKIQPSIHQ